MFVALSTLASSQDEFPTRPAIVGKGLVIDCCDKTPHLDIGYSTLTKHFSATRGDYGCIARMDMRLNLKEAQHLSKCLTALSNGAVGSAIVAIDGCDKDIAIAMCKITAPIEASALSFALGVCGR